MSTFHVHIKTENFEKIEKYKRAFFQTWILNLEHYSIKIRTKYIITNPWQKNNYPRHPFDVFRIAKIMSRTYRETRPKIIAKAQQMVALFWQYLTNFSRLNYSRVAQYRLFSCNSAFRIFHESFSADWNISARWANSCRKERGLSRMQMGQLAT